MGGWGSKPSEEIQVSKQPALASRKSSIGTILRRKSVKDKEKAESTPTPTPKQSETDSTVVVAFQPIAEDHHRSNSPPPPPPKPASRRESKDQTQDDADVPTPAQQEPPVVVVDDPPTIVVAPSPPPPPPVDPIGDGGYLVFSTASDGTLTLHFSVDRVPDAIMYFKPKRIVPAFKYRQNAGRVEILRKLQSNQQLYFEACAQFVKMGREFDSDFVVLPQDKPTVQVWRLFDTSKIAICNPGEFFTSASFSSIACLPRDCQIFKGVQSMSRENFISAANKVGKAFSF